MPCAKAIIPLPKLLTRLPELSNFSTESKSDILPVAGSAQLLTPHRSATQIDLPSLSISTALVDPHVRPSGSLAQPSMLWYGFGASLVGAIAAVCPDVAVPDAATAATTAPKAANFAHRASAITLLQLSRSTGDYTCSTCALSTAKDSRRHVTATRNPARCSRRTSTSSGTYTSSFDQASRNPCAARGE